MEEHHSKIIGRKLAFFLIESLQQGFLWPLVHHPTYMVIFFFHSVWKPRNQVYLIKMIRNTFAIFSSNGNNYFWEQTMRRCIYWISISRIQFLCCSLSLLVIVRKFMFSNLKYGIATFHQGNERSVHRKLWDIDDRHWRHTNK